MSPESLRRRLQALSDNKCQLESQLADCQVQVEEGAKAFHKTNDERRAYLWEMAKVSHIPCSIGKARWLTVTCPAPPSCLPPSKLRRGIVTRCARGPPPRAQPGNPSSHLANTDGRAPRSIVCRRRAGGAAGRESETDGGKAKGPSAARLAAQLKRCRLGSGLKRGVKRRTPP
ncbi:coiled-coil domain-containing protein 169 isoform X2 [Stigmatopora nigra]